MKRPEKLPESAHPQKHKLKNAIISWLEVSKLGWERDSVNTLGIGFIHTLGDVMWYIDGNHDTLKNGGSSVPVRLKQFSGYRQPEKQKKKRLAPENLSCDQIDAFSKVLFNLSMASYMKKAAWVSVCSDIIQLAKAFQKYAEYLKQNLTTKKKAHEDLQSPHSKSSDHFKIQSAECRPASMCTSTYSKLHEALHNAGDEEPLDINSFAPAKRNRRFEFIQNLSVPFKCILYTHSGGAGSNNLNFIWKVSKVATEDDLLNGAHKIAAMLAPSFPVYYSRALRTQFSDVFGKVTNIKSAVYREMHRRLTGDHSAPANETSAQVDARLKLRLQRKKLRWFALVYT